MKKKKTYPVQKAAYYRKHREKFLAQERERQYRVKYGITVAKYEEMLAEQGGCCKLCTSGVPGSRTKHFAVDHDHTTGEVRGLLCLKCNWRLGWYEAHADAVLQYLKGK